jgi:long-subunit acyl-CoA synthetase (AMP-forming)
MSLSSLVVERFREFATRPCLGQRRGVAIGDPFVYLSFEQAYTLAERIGEWLNGRCVGDDGMMMVGVLVRNSVQFYTIDLGCCLYGICSVPLYRDMSAENVGFILTQTEMKCLICDLESVDLICAAATLPSSNWAISTIIVTDLLNFNIFEGELWGTETERERSLNRIDTAKTKFSSLKNISVLSFEEMFTNPHPPKPRLQKDIPPHSLFSIMFV